MPRRSLTGATAGDFGRSPDRLAYRCLTLDRMLHASSWFFRRGHSGLLRRTRCATPCRNEDAAPRPNPSAHCGHNGRRIDSGTSAPSWRSATSDVEAGGRCVAERARARSDRVPAGRRRIWVHGAGAAAASRQGCGEAIHVHIQSLRTRNSLSTTWHGLGTFSARHRCPATGKQA